MVSACEDYCQAALTELVERGLAANVTGERLWDAVIDSTFTSWTGHLQLWGRWGVEVLKSDEYKEFQGFIAARNSAVHGLGELTRIQRRKSKVQDEIRSAGLKISGTRVVIDEVGLGLCASAAIKFVTYVDRELDALLQPSSG